MLGSRRRVPVAGRTVVLTGAAGGIGRAIARRLDAEGAHLALVDRDAEGLAALAATLDPATSRHVVDLRDRAALEALPERILADHDALDVLVNNAGVTVHGPLSAHTADDVDLVLDVDLRAVVHAVRVFTPHLTGRPGAHVVNVASMAGLQGFPFQTTYSAAKFGLRGFGQALRPELAARGIGCSTLLPGTIATSLLRATPSRDPASSERLATLMERYGTSPDRVAAAVVRALRHDPAEVRVGWDAHLLAATQRVWPGLLPRLLTLLLRRGFFGAGSA